MGVHRRHVEGVGRIKAIPDIPITVMAERETHAAGAARTAPPLPEARPAARPRRVRERWNDYGIGLLLQGDLKGAEAAFLKVTEMDPRYADGWVNVARARIQEGNMTGAEEMLRKALAIDPTLAKTHFFLGTALKSLGPLRRGARAPARTLPAQYPRDRVVLNQLGRVLFLQRQYARGGRRVPAACWRSIPEDLQAHYNLMLCYQGLGDAAARGARASALRTLQGRRVGAGHHRDRTGSCTPTTTTSGSRSTSTRRSALAGLDRRHARARDATGGR